jgi:pyruvate dehydrogenase E2 component (dihydrolipoamide acetyltransferase)
MSEELVMPRLSDTMEEGTIGRWLVHEGDAFAAGDVLAEIETDKATMEFQAYDAGTVLRILVGDGETVALGAPIAIVGAEGETADEAASAGNGATTPPPQEEAAAEPEPKAAPARKPSKSSSKAKAAAGNGSRAAAALRVSPIARRMADEAGIDLAAMAGRGSGPEGRVVKADV